MKILLRATALAFLIPSPAVAQQAAQSLSLGEALRLAETRSPEVRVANAAVTRARGREMQARSQLFPQIFGSGQYTRTLRSQFSALSSEPDTGAPPPPGPCDQYLRGAGTTIEERVAGLEQASRCAIGFNPFSGLGRVGFGAENEYRLGLSMSQNLFAGGRVRAQIEGARAAREAADVGLRSARAQVALDVAEAYFDAALADRLATIAELSLRQAEGTVRQAELAHQVGSTSEFELLRARVARDNQRPIVIERRSTRDVAFLRLRQLIGLPLDASIALATAVEDTSAAVAAIGERAPSGATGDTAVARRAPVRQAAAAERAQRSELTATRSQRFPQLTLSSQYGRIAFPLEGLPSSDEFRENWTVAVGLQVPLFTGGRIRGEEISARASLEEARGRLDLARQLAELDARIQLNTLAQAEAAWLASAGTAEQAARAFRIAEVRYREGISTQLELDDARLLLEQAQVNRAVAARNLQIARLRLALLSDLPLQLDRAGASAAAAAAAAAQTPADQQQQPSTTRQQPTAAAQSGAAPGGAIP